jgi:hypothetical protein
VAAGFIPRPVRAPAPDAVDLAVSAA